MKAQALVTQNHGETARDTLIKLMEGCEMKAADAITKVNNWLSHSSLRKTPGKLLGALAIGGLIMTVAVVTPSSAFADEPSRPLSATEPGARLTLEDYFAAATAPAPTPTEPGALLTLEDILARTSKLDTPGSGPEGTAASSSVPATEAYQAFTLWEFPDMNQVMTKDKAVSRSVGPSEAYQAFALWEFPDMNHELIGREPAVHSAPATEAYQAFALWEFPDMNHELIGRKSAVHSVPATEAYNAFTYWEFPASRLEPYWADFPN